MTEYWIFDNGEPGAPIKTIFAESKREALTKYNELTGKKYKFTNNNIGLSLTTKYDWLHYNFSKVSTITSVKCQVEKVI